MRPHRAVPYTITRCMWLLAEAISNCERRSCRCMFLSGTKHEHDQNPSKMNENNVHETNGRTKEVAIRCSECACASVSTAVRDDCCSSCCYCWKFEFVAAALLLLLFISVRTKLSVDWNKTDSSSWHSTVATFIHTERFIQRAAILLSLVVFRRIQRLYLDLVKRIFLSVSLAEWKQRREDWANYEKKKQCERDTNFECDGFFVVPVEHFCCCVECGYFYSRVFFLLLKNVERPESIAEI